MSNAFVGEIKVVGFNFAPRGYAFCNGQLMSIQQNAALFSLLGTTYGGNGTTTFALPDLRDAAPMHWGQGIGLTNRDLGEALGTPSVSLLGSEVPPHVHGLNAGVLASPNPSQNVPTPGSTAVLGPSNPGPTYTDATTPVVAMAPQAIGPGGNGQPHENRHPLLALNFVIALQGVYPSRN